MDKTDAKRTLTKVRRAASAINRGDEILACVEEHRGLLIEGANEGVPPVSKIGSVLDERFGDHVRLLPVRQWVGSLVKALLAVEGYEVEERGVRFRDRVFKSGSTYIRLAGDDVAASGDAGAQAVEETFRRLVKGLTVRDRALLVKALGSAHT